MIINNRWVAVIFLVGVLGAAPMIMAVETEEIDTDYSRAYVSNDVLDDSDFRTIDVFLQSALEEMFLTEDFWEITGLRAEIIARKPESTPSQY